MRSTTNLIHHKPSSFIYRSLLVALRHHSDLPAQDQLSSAYSSLMARRLYERSPVSYGILDFYGAYHKLIPSQSELPCARSCNMRSVFDYARSGEYPVCYRRSLLEGAVQIFTFTLNDILVADKEHQKSRVTMAMSKDLVGTLTVRNYYTDKITSSISQI